MHKYARAGYKCIKICSIFFFLKAHHCYIARYKIQCIAGDAVFRYCFQYVEESCFPGTRAGHAGGSGIVKFDIAAVNSKCNIKTIATALTRCPGLRKVKCYDRFFMI